MSAKITPIRPDVPTGSKLVTLDSLDDIAFLRTIIKIFLLYGKGSAVIHQDHLDRAAATPQDLATVLAPDGSIHFLLVDHK